MQSRTFASTLVAKARVVINHNLEAYFTTARFYDQHYVSHPGDTRLKTSVSKADHHHKNFCVFFSTSNKKPCECLKLGHFHIPPLILKCYSLLIVTFTT